MQSWFMDWGENLSTKVFVQDSNVRSKLIAGSICWKLTQVWSPSWVFVKNWPKHKAAFFRCSWGSIFQLIPTMTRDQDSIQLRGQRKHNSKWFYIYNGGWFHFYFHRLHIFKRPAWGRGGTSVSRLVRMTDNCWDMSMCCQCAANVLPMYCQCTWDLGCQFSNALVQPSYHLFNAIMSFKWIFPVFPWQWWF